MIWKIPEPKSQKENDWFSLPNSSLESGSLSYLHFLRRRNWWRLSSYKARESDVVVVVVALPVVQVCHSLCQARRELSETLRFFLQEVSSGGMFRRKIHPRKKKKNMEPENSSWKRRKHLKAPISGFHVIVFGVVLLEVLSSPWNLTNRYSKQPNIWRKCILSNAIIFGIYW